MFCYFGQNKNKGLNFTWYKVRETFKVSDVITLHMLSNIFIFKSENAGSKV